MNPGRYLNYPASRYHADDALGSTDIRAAADESVAHAIANKITKSTPAMVRGSLVHCLTLEPETFDESFVVPQSGQCQGLTKKKTQCSKPAVLGACYCGIHGGNDESEAWLESLPAGCEVVSQSQVDEANAIVDGITRGVARLDEPYCHLLDGGDREVSYYATAVLIDEHPGYRIIVDPDAVGIAIHCRVDLDYPGKAIDLKNVGTPDGLTDHGFANVMARRGLCVQAALYVDIIKAVTNIDTSWSWLAVQPVEPYGLRIFDCDPDDIEAGRAEVNTGLRRWAAYRDQQNEWLDWPTTPTTVRLPNWKVEE